MEFCDKVLIRYFGALSFLLVLAFVVVVGGIICCIKMKLPKPLAIFLACCMLILIVPTIYIGCGFKDLYEKDYIVYYGDFSVSERNQLHGNLILRDEKQTYIRMQGDFPLSNGEYTGYIVYSQRTHLLLAYAPHTNPLIIE